MWCCHEMWPQHKFFCQCIVIMWSVVGLKTDKYGHKATNIIGDIALATKTCLAVGKFATRPDLTQILSSPNRRCNLPNVEPCEIRPHLIVVYHYCVHILGSDNKYFDWIQQRLPWTKQSPFVQHQIVRVCAVDPLELYSPVPVKR